MVSCGDGFELDVAADVDPDPLAPVGEAGFGRRETVPVPLWQIRRAAQRVEGYGPKRSDDKMQIREAIRGLCSPRQREQIQDIRDNGELLIERPRALAAESGLPWAGEALWGIEFETG
eukprot:537780-Pyramimonas_sp.AAC.1